jgi:hypothetical protein
VLRIKYENYGVGYREEFLKQTQAGRSWKPTEMQECQIESFEKLHPKRKSSCRPKKHQTQFSELPQLGTLIYSIHSPDEGKSFDCWCAFDGRTVPERLGLQLALENNSK